MLFRSREALDSYGGVLLGGDCSGGVQRILAVTAIGRLPSTTALAAEGPPGERRILIGPEGGPPGAIRRGDGRPGDALLSTGPHGLSRLGLALLQGELATGAAARDNAAEALTTAFGPAGAPGEAIETGN